MQVPVYERQAKQEGLPNARQNISVDASNFLGGTEQAAIGYSERALNDVGHAVNHIYAQQLHEARQTRLLDASTQMQAHVQDAMYGSNGALTKTGADAFLGSDGKTVSDLAFDDVLKKQNAIADTLVDEQQKAEFKQHTNSMLMSMRGQLMSHEAEQHRVYTQSTLESSNAVQGNNITLNYNNPDSIKTSIAQIKANSGQLAKLHGYDELWASTHAQSNISDALNKSVDTATTNNDHNTALKILHDFSPEMNQNDLLKNYQKISKAQSDVNAVNAATSTMQGFAGRFTPQDGERLNNLIAGAESGHQHFGENSQPTTSPAGAIGKWQIMPDTGPEAAKLAGVTWNKELFMRARTGNKALDDEAEQYNETLGKAYFQKQVQDNHGDTAKALASYNAGPSATQQAVKQAAKDGAPDNWLAYLPKETRVYVGKIANKYASGEGNRPPPTLQEVQAQTLAQIPNATLDERTTALQEVTRQFKVNEDAIKAHNDYSTAEAIRVLEKNGGDFMALPQAMREAIPTEDLSKVHNFAKSKQEGRNESNLVVYNHLSANPDFLVGLSDDAYMKLAPELSDADFKHFATQRASLKKPAAGDSPDNLDSGSVNASLNNLLNQLGIDPTPKDSDTAKKMQVGAIRKYVNDSLLSAQAQTGKKMKDVEIEKYVSGLFAKSVKFRTSTLWGSIDTGTDSQRIMTMKADDIPSDDRNAIKSQFEARGITPTDGDILSYFWQAQHAKGSL